MKFLCLSISLEYRSLIIVGLPPPDKASVIAFAYDNFVQKCKFYYYEHRKVILISFFMVIYIILFSYSAWAKIIASTLWIEGLSD